MLNVNVPCLFSLAGSTCLHLLCAVAVDGAGVVHVDAAPCRGSASHSRALCTAPGFGAYQCQLQHCCAAGMSAVFCPRFWQYCSDCTRWTPFSLGLTALDIHRHSGLRLDLLHAGPKQEQKFLCSCLFWRQAGIAAVWSLDQRNC